MKEKIEWPSWAVARIRTTYELKSDNGKRQRKAIAGYIGKNGLKRPDDLKVEFLEELFREKIFTPDNYINAAAKTAAKTVWPKRD